MHSKTKIRLFFESNEEPFYDVFRILQEHFFAPGEAEGDVYVSNAKSIKMIGFRFYKDASYMNVTLGEN